MDLKYLIKEAKYYYKVNGFWRMLKKFILTNTPVRKLVNTPFYNKIYKKRIMKRSGLQPKYLLIETTNICNARCKMCPHVIMKRKQRIMSLEDYKKVLDNVMKNYKIERLTLNGFGEPFIDKGIFDKINYTNMRYPKLKIDLYTNAALLTSEIADKLLKVKIDRITFSINGDEETYKDVMGLDYQNTKKNVINFLVKKRNTKNKVLTNISMMILKNNADKAKNFIEFWRRYADSVRVYYPSDWAGALKENLGKQTIPYNRKQWPCMGIFAHIAIHSNGEFIVCCRDYESKVQFGNLIKGDDIKELREGKEFKKLQKNHLNFNFSSQICKNCDHALDSSIDWWL